LFFFCFFPLLFYPLCLVHPPAQQAGLESYLGGAWFVYRPRHGLSLSNSREMPG
jgi:hypothetical protein